jgi:hypothetical protein
MTDFSTEALWLIGPILLGVGYGVFALTFLKRTMQQSLHEAASRSWRKPLLFLAASNIIPIVAFWAWGSTSHLSLKCSVLVVVPIIAMNAMVAGAAWSLALVFAARNRHYNEWASLQIN